MRKTNDNLVYTMNVCLKKLKKEGKLGTIAGQIYFGVYQSIKKKGTSIENNSWDLSYGELLAAMSQSKPFPQVF